MTVIINMKCFKNIITSCASFALNFEYSFLCRIFINYNTSCDSLSFWCTFINLFILVLSIPDLKNPGPCNNNHMSVFYQNVQGLIPFSQLNNPNPMLDQTKYMEIHACIYEQEPDIIILNETWLKPSIEDNEIIPSNLYKIFRRDRSASSHPIDPDDPIYLIHIPVIAFLYVSTLSLQILLNLLIHMITLAHLKSHNPLFQVYSSRHHPV